MVHTFMQFSKWSILQEEKKRKKLITRKIKAVGR